MGRPAASEENKVIAVAFARIVTIHTTNADDIVARCGSCSIYALLKHACPAIVRDERNGPRDGITEVEFNKALQVSLKKIYWNSK